MELVLLEPGGYVSDINPADALRTPTTALESDPRSDRDEDALASRWQAIAALYFGPEVPESVAIHFETAKNVLLYAFFVYRFHMVAEQYVLSTLELALRERLLRDNLIQVKDDWVPGLKLMMGRARDHKLISNDRFEPGRALARRRAEHRHSVELIRRMQQEGLTEVSYDPAQIELTAEDLSFDWIKQFTDSLPDLRNMHAHGTSNLYPTVFNTFRTVHNLVGQMFSASAPADPAPNYSAE